MTPAFLGAFATCVAFTLRDDIEGGLADDPRDPGGITNMGLTIADLSVWERHRATADDVRSLQRPEAVAIYQALYWAPIRGWAMPPAIALMVFDAAVNRGVGTSAKILQRILRVVVDGMIGPQTLSALTVAAFSGAPALVDQLWLAQRADYMALGNPVYENGWLARADKRHAAAVALLTGQSE